MISPNYGYWVDRWLRSPSPARKSPRYHLGEVGTTETHSKVVIYAKCGLIINGNPAGGDLMFEACPSMASRSLKLASYTCDQSLHCKVCSRALASERGPHGHRR